MLWEEGVELIDTTIIKNDIKLSKNNYSSLNHCIDYHFKSKNNINLGINKKYWYKLKSLLWIPGLLNPNCEV